MYTHAPISSQRSWMCDQCASAQWSFWTQTLHSPITQGWIRQVPLGSWMTTLGIGQQLARALHQLALFLLHTAQGLAHTLSTFQHLNCEEKVFPSYQAQTSKKPLQSLSHLIGYCNNDGRLILAKIRSLCPLHQVAVHKSAWPATGKFLTYFWLHGYFSWINLQQASRPV